MYTFFVGHLESSFFPLSSKAALALSDQCIDNSIGESAELGLLVPLCLSSLNLFSTAVAPDGIFYKLVEGRNGTVGGTKDERLVARVDVGIDEGGGLTISSSHDNGFCSHNIFVYIKDNILHKFNK